MQLELSSSTLLISRAQHNLIPDIMDSNFPSVMDLDGLIQLLGNTIKYTVLVVELDYLLDFRGCYNRVWILDPIWVGGGVVCGGVFRLAIFTRGCDIFFEKCLVKYCNCIVNLESL